MKVKKIPQRMCTGCMEMKPKKELIRVVKNKENEISIDLHGKNDEIYDKLKEEIVNAE